MKKTFMILLSTLALFAMVSCDLLNTEKGIDGEQSELGEVGTTISGNFSGLSNTNLKIVSLEDGISTIEGTFKMTDDRYMDIIKDYPKFFDVDGSDVHVHDVKFQVTDQGIYHCSGEENGIVIRYDSKVGDTYSNGRKVTHVSDDNDFNWGLMKIKVIKVECDVKKKDGVKHVNYWGNHRFGIVAVEVEFEDGTVDYSPFYIR